MDAQKKPVLPGTRANAVVLRYGELFLKGRNRHVFENALLAGVRRALAARRDLVAERLHGRVWVEGVARGEPISDVPEVLNLLARVFGVSTLSPVVDAAPDLALLKSLACGVVASMGFARPTRFAVATNRADKRFPMRSPDISRAIAEACLDSCPHLVVDLRNPEFTLGVEIGAARSFVFAGVRDGAGGLPSGTGGRIVLLLSGGIDSPVAGYLMARRGCEVRPVYFHAAPYTGEGARAKVMDLAHVLSTFHGPVSVSVVPFAKAQETLRVAAPGKLLVVLYRRLMLRIAERIATAVGARGIATGENLGQVASQTLDNIGVIEAVTRLPVLRPLIGFDKRETIRIAQSIGTFEISTRPFADCCSLFVPKHPETHARIEEVEEVERRVDVEALADAAVRDAEAVAVE